MMLLKPSRTEVGGPVALDEVEREQGLVAVDDQVAHGERSRRRQLRLLDGGMLALAAIIATVADRIVAADGGSDRTFTLQVPLALLYVAVALVALDARGLYVQRLGAAPLDDLGRIASGTALAGMSLVTGSVFLGGDIEVTSYVARLWAFGSIYLCAGRAGLAVSTRRARRRDVGGAATLLIGAGTVGQRLAHRLIERPEFGLRPVGFLDKEPRLSGLDDMPVPVLGASWDLERVAVEHDVRQVIITFSTAPHAVLLDLSRRCSRLGIQVSVVPRLFEHLTRRLSVEHIGGIPLLSAGQVDPKGWQIDLKYTVDRLVVAAMILVLSPLLAAVALAVKLSSPGGVFHRQRRIGLDGREFTLLKFRSMTGSPERDGEADAQWLAEAGDDAGESPRAPGTVPTLAPPPDRRTAIGRLLRRTSLDELPQLFNILRGDMSFIGPRPERVTAVRAVEQRVYRYGDRHRVKSGLTGWAQVNGLRGKTSLADRVEWDNYYIENWSFWLDVKILVQTVPAVLGGSGAE